MNQQTFGIVVTLVITVFFVLLTAVLFTGTGNNVTPEVKGVGTTTADVAIDFDELSYTWTDRINLRIYSTDDNTNDNVSEIIGDSASEQVRIITHGHAINNFQLTEIGTDTSLFVNDVQLTGFLHDVDGDGTMDTNPRTNDNGFIQALGCDELIVIYSKDDDIRVWDSVPIRWMDGELQLTDEWEYTDPSDLSASMRMDIQVDDRDMNLDPDQLDSIQVHVSSNADPEGIDLKMEESSGVPGRFFETLLLSSVNDSFGNRLHVNRIDEVTVTYNDRTTIESGTLSQTQRIFDLINTERIKNLELETFVDCIYGIKDVTESEEVIVRDGFWENIEEMPIARVQLALETSRIGHANTDDDVGIKLNLDNEFWLDSGEDPDFHHILRWGSDLVMDEYGGYTYDLGLNGITTLQDIEHLEIFKNGNGAWCIETLALFVNGKEIFNEYFDDEPEGCKWLDNTYDPDEERFRNEDRHITFSSDTLRAHEKWINYIPPYPFIDFETYHGEYHDVVMTEKELGLRIEAMVGDTIKSQPVEWDLREDSDVVEISKKNDQTLGVNLDLETERAGLATNVTFDMVTSCNDNDLSIEIENIDHDDSWALDTVEFFLNSIELVLAAFGQFFFLGLDIDLAPSLDSGVSVEELDTRFFVGHIEHIIEDNDAEIRNLLCNAITVSPCPFEDPGIDVGLCDIVNIGVRDDDSIVISLIDGFQDIANS